MPLACLHFQPWLLWGRVGIQAQRVEIHEVPEWLDGSPLGIMDADSLPRSPAEAPVRYSKRMSLV